MSNSHTTSCSSCDFEKSYEQSKLPIMREVEASVLGSDYGGTSWTTLAQARQIAEKLSLGPGVNHLEVGSGSGWPGLYLSTLSGCGVTLVDIPMIALEMSRLRAQRDGLQNKTHSIMASGTNLPFRKSAFDTVGHSDVLCCLAEKSEMLSECKRVLHTSGQMLFSVISIKPGISGSDYLRAVEAGPPFIEVKSAYENLLADCGWKIMERLDVSEEHARSLEALVENMTVREAEMAAALGQEELMDQKQRRMVQIAVIRAGLMQREIFHVRPV